MFIRLTIISVVFLFALAAYYVPFIIPFGHSNPKQAEPFMTMLAFAGPALFVIFRNMSNGERIAKFLVPILASIIVIATVFVLMYQPFTLGREPFDFHRIVTAYGINPVLIVFTGIMMLLFCIPLVFPFQSFSLTWYALVALVFSAHLALMTYFAFLKTPNFIG